MKHTKGLISSGIRSMIFRGSALFHTSICINHKGDSELMGLLCCEKPYCTDANRQRKRNICFIRGILFILFDNSHYLFIIKKSRIIQPALLTNNQLFNKPLFDNNSLDIYRSVCTECLNDVDASLRLSQADTIYCIVLV